MGGVDASRKDPIFLEGDMHLGGVLKDMDQAKCFISKELETFRKNNKITIFDAIDNAHRSFGFFKCSKTLLKPDRDI